MYRNNEKIAWLLVESNAKYSEIAKKCQINLKKLYKLKKDKELIKELANAPAHRLTVYAQEILELHYYEEYRWVVTDNRQLELYNFRNLNGMNRDAKLVSQVSVTPEVKKYEHIKKINTDIPLFTRHLADARKAALNSVGF